MYDATFADGQARSSALYLFPMRVVVLGAGFGGLELSTSLSEKFGYQADVVLIDQSEDFVFGFSKLDVMFGRTLPTAVRHPYRDLVKPGVQFVRRHRDQD